MRIGLSMPIVQQVPGRAQPWEASASRQDLVRVAQTADRLGFAWISCSDHVAVPRSYAESMGASWYEPVSTLSFLAAHTERVALLSHVLVLPYRHPLLVAKSFATLDRLSGGRVIVGVGAGHLKPEFATLGLSHAERGRHTDENLRALCLALEQECSSFDGQYSRWRDMIVAPRPLQSPRPPIWVGGNGKAAVQRAALLGDGWIPWEIEPSELRQRVQLLRDLRAGDLANFTVVAPESFKLGDSAEGFNRRLESWSAAGATAIHAGIEGDTLALYLERMERLAEAASLRA